MSNATLYKKISKELDRLNDRIDVKIVKGLKYEKDAKRHKYLLATLQRIGEESQPHVRISGRRSCVGKSPVRSTFKQGVFARVFTRGFAY